MSARIEYSPGVSPSSLLARVLVAPASLFPLKLLRSFPAILAGLLFGTVAHGWQSTRVQTNAEGRLTYPADAAGNRIPDFSHAGYRGGGVPLPVVPVVRSLSPTTGDQTSRIQAALDQVASLPVQADGYRGALRLEAGTWLVLGTLRLSVDGVVLSGVGDGDDPALNTILRRTGTSATAIIQAGVRNDSFRSERAGTRSQILNPRVQVGDRTVEVDHPEYYRVGDPVIVWHPSTQAWLDAVDRGGVTDANFWKPGEIDLRYHRYVTAISGQTLTFDAPVFNHLDRALSQSYLYTYNSAHVVRRLGVEKLRVDIVTAGELTDTHAEDAITFTGAEDSWIRDSTLRHFWHAGVQFEGSTRCTAERCRAIDPHSPIDGGYRYNFSTYHAQQILFRECFTSHARHAFVCNGTSLDSGIVILDSVIDHPKTSAEGHRRWSTAILFDNVTTTNRDTSDIIRLYNRNTYGTGHGWAAAHSVVWASNASTGGKIVVQQPPTAQNYAIGCFGTVTGSGPFAGPAGFIEGSNRAGLEPRSLYLAQVADRLASAGAPVLVESPRAQTIPLGRAVVFSVGAKGEGLTYQWEFNGASLAGATEPILWVRSAGTAQAGVYRVVVSNVGGSIASVPVNLSVAEPATAGAGRLINLSVLTTVSNPGDTFILGYVVGGDPSANAKPVVLRAVGPSLAFFGVADPLANPRLEFFLGTTAQGENDNWGGSAELRAAFTAVGAFPFSGSATLDAAAETTVSSSANSVRISGVGGSTGTVLAEVYEAPTPTGLTLRKLMNVSVLKEVSSGLSAGFVIGGDTAHTVLIRAIGPGLAPFGLAGLLADPTLELFGGSTLLMANQDWSGSTALHGAFAATGAFDLPPTSRDSALVATLSPGNYTARVTGTAASAGVTLVEVYSLDP